MTAEIIKKELVALGNPEKAAHHLHFFKTGKGEYGEGDIFVGCTVPESRAVAKKNKNVPLSEIEKLLNDEIHECRFCGLILLTQLFDKGAKDDKKAVVDFYLSHTYAINNWDLVDVSSYAILGKWLMDKPERSILYRLAESESMWEQRIAMVATMSLIRNHDFEDALRLSEKFLTHRHDLMHKASGWMLREVGKKDEQTLTDFLDKHYLKMPRTMLRYAIEKLNPEQKAYYMKK